MRGAVLYTLLVICISYVTLTATTPLAVANAKVNAPAANLVIIPPLLNAPIILTNILNGTPLLNTITTIVNIILNFQVNLPTLSLPSIILSLNNQTVNLTPLIAAQLILHPFQNIDLISFNLNIATNQTVNNTQTLMPIVLNFTNTDDFTAQNVQNTLVTEGIPASQFNVTNLSSTTPNPPMSLSNMNVNAIKIDISSSAIYETFSYLPQNVLTNLTTQLFG